MSTYAVVQVSAYIHGVWGPFSSFEEAKDLVDEFVAHPDEDGHHWYCVTTFPVTYTKTTKSLYTAQAPAKRWISVRTRDAAHREECK